MKIKLKICFPIIFIPLVMSLLIKVPDAESKTMLIGFKQGGKKDSLPDGWEEITYLRTRKNRISVSKDGKYTVLKVKSIGSASALLKKLKIDLHEFPILVWRWKINRVPGMAIETRKDRNDSAARIRVIFNKKEKRPSYKSPEISKLFEKLRFHLGTFEPRGFKIDYIWGNTTPKGKVINYPDSGNHKVVIIES